MVLTKNQAKIMQLFTANITKRFSIRKVAREIGIDYAHVHQSIKPLIEKGILQEDDEKFLSLNLRAHDNFQLFAYVEGLRAEGILKQRGKQSLRVFVDRFFEKFKEDFFVFLLFGSAVENKKPRDYDILLVVDSLDKVEPAEKLLNSIAWMSNEEFDIQVISTESVHEMWEQREQLNVMNETLNKHIIFFGAQSYYWMLKNVRR